MSTARPLGKPGPATARALIATLALALSPGAGTAHASPEMMTEPGDLEAPENFDHKKMLQEFSDAIREPDPGKRTTRLEDIIQRYPKRFYMHIAYAGHLAFTAGRLDDAEKHYQTAIQLLPRRGLSHLHYARFLWLKRGNLEAAEGKYKDAILHGHSGCELRLPYIEFLIATKRWNDAAAHAKSLCDFRVNGNPAEADGTFFVVWMLERRSGRDGRQALGRLKTMLRSELPFHSTVFSDALPVILHELPENERRLAEKLSAALKDSKKIADLETEPLWKQTEPIKPMEEWPDLLTGYDTGSIERPQRPDDRKEQPAGLNK